MSDKKPSEIIRERAAEIRMNNGYEGLSPAYFIIPILEYLDQLVERYENSTLGDQNRILFLEQRLERLEKKG